MFPCRNLRQAESAGHLLPRLDHGPWLNAPWGLALAPLDFGRFSHDLLIEQFAGGGTTESSGFIAAYDLATGKSMDCCRMPVVSRWPLMISGRLARQTLRRPAQILMKSRPQRSISQRVPDKALVVYLDI